MFPILLLLFISLPIAEIALLLKVGSGLGFLNALGFVIFTAVLGAYLVRQQGLSTLSRVQAETNAGRMPATEMAEGVALLIAGAVLLTPGFITDAFGFALLIPGVRRALIKRVALHSVVSAGSTAQGSQNGFVFTSRYSRPPRSSKPESNKPSKPGVIIEGRYRDGD